MHLSRAVSKIAKEMAGRAVEINGAVKGNSAKTRKNQAAFLQAVEMNCSIAASARITGISRSTHYDWLDNDPQYEAKFERKLLIAADTIKDRLCRLGMKGIFKPFLYKGSFCQAVRERTICELADGRSAFEDELPIGAIVTKRRTVRVHDGEVLGRFVTDDRALIKLAGVLMPDEFPPIRRIKKAKAKEVRRDAYPKRFEWAEESD